MLPEALVVASCLGQVGCTESWSSYEWARPDTAKTVRARVDQIVNYTPEIIREYWFPYMVYLSGRKATITVAGPIKVEVSNKVTNLLYIKSF